jgi:hypothetical protein
MFLWMVLFSSTIISCGCGTMPTIPTEADLKVADYGPKPSESALQTHEVAVRAVKEAELKDPASAIYKFYPPEKGWFIGRKSYRDGIVNNQVRFAWRVSFSVNAKNGYGGYTGAKSEWTWMRGDEVVGSGYAGDDYYDIGKNREDNDYDWGDSEQSP